MAVEMIVDVGKERNIVLFVSFCPFSFLIRISTLIGGRHSFYRGISIFGRKTHPNHTVAIKAEPLDFIRSLFFVNLRVLLDRHTLLPQFLTWEHRVPHLYNTYIDMFFCGDIVFSFQQYWWLEHYTVSQDLRFTCGLHPLEDMQVILWLFKHANRWDGSLVDSQ